MGLFDMTPEQANNLTNFGFATMSAASQPGATTLGSIGQGGLGMNQAALQRAQQQNIGEETQAKHLQNTELFPLQLQQMKFDLNTQRHLPEMLAGTYDASTDPIYGNSKQTLPQIPATPGGGGNSSPTAGVTPRMPTTTMQLSNPPSSPDSFGNAMKFVMNQEGGYVSNDSGKGPTKYGINSEANPDIDLDKLTPEGAQNIYKQRYWNAIGGDNLPPALATVALDTAVNHGVPAAKMMLQASGGDPNTMIALRRYAYNNLATQNPDKYGKNLAGWNSRLDSLQQTIQQPSDNRNAGQGLTGNAQPQQNTSSNGQTANGEQQTPKMNVGKTMANIALGKINPRLGVELQREQMAPVLAAQEAAAKLPFAIQESAARERGTALEKQAEKVDTDATNATQSNYLLDNILTAARNVPVGKFAHYKENYLAYKNALGLSDPADDKILANYQDMDKNAIALRTQAVKQISARPSQMEFVQVGDALPNKSLSQGGLDLIGNQSQAVNDWQIAKQQAQSIWRQSHPTLEGFETEFNSKVSPATFLFHRLSPEDLKVTVANLQKTDSGKKILRSVMSKMEYAHQNGYFGQ